MAESKGGGINTYVTNLVDHLHEKLPLDDVVVAFVEGDDEHNYRMPKNPVLLTFGMLWFLYKNKPNIIHVHESFEMLIGAAMYRTLHEDVRLINTVHTEPIVATRLVRKFVKSVKNIIYRWAWERCDYVSFVSKALERKIESINGHIVNPKIAITYAGTDIKKVTDDELSIFKKRFNLGSSDIIILAQALTSPKPKAEGLKLLIYCMSLLRLKYNNIKLLVTKNGTYVKELEDYAKSNGVQDCIAFAGDIKNPFIAVKTADIICHITKAEGGFTINTRSNDHWQTNYCLKHWGNEASNISKIYDCGSVYMFI